MTPTQDLLSRALPPLCSQDKMVDLLQREVYGYLPSVPHTLSVSDPTAVEGRYDLGRVEHSFVTLTVHVGDRSHAFRVDRLLHRDQNKHPLIVYNDFHKNLVSPYFPVEQLSESEADFLVVHYRDVTSDDADFASGLAPLLLPDGQSTDTACGKIGIWAWASMRVLDYGLTLPGTDARRIGIAGHSRLGKTALFTAMMDTRFTFVLSNAAGCAGDAIAHGGSGLFRTGDPHASGERIDDITATFPYWFCKNYRKYAEKNVSDSFDQHFLLASIAPRYVLIGSCDHDPWADPTSQYLCALAASEAWEREGLVGLVGTDTYPTEREARLDGHVGFFSIHSLHFMSRHSWENFLAFIRKHGGQTE